MGARAVEREVARAVEGWGAAGIKLEICNNAADTRWMTPVMTAAARWDLPVLQHSWSQTNIRERSFHTDQEDTCRLARRHPEVRLIIAHLTGCGRRGVKCTSTELDLAHLDFTFGLKREAQECVMRRLEGKLETSWCEDARE